MPPNVSVVAPEGELDVATLDDFRTTLSDAVSRPSDVLVLDLSEVSFIDSSSLGAVVEAGERLRRDRRRLSVVAPPGSAAAVVLELTGLRGRLPTFATRDAALDP
jgi:anti-anti-sigma factor